MVNGTLILKMIFTKLFYALQDSTQKFMRTGINYKCNLNMESKLLGIICIQSELITSVIQLSKFHYIEFLNLLPRTHTWTWDIRAK